MEPITRKEKFLAKAGGQDVGELDPITREEHFISQIGGGGGGGGGESTIAWKPTVSADGTISWTRTSSTDKPEEQNIKGPKGDTGEQGEKGDAGPEGPSGEKGDSGVSPTITVTDIEGGHRVTITDEDHPQGQSFDVMDGDGSKLVAMTAEKVLEILNA